MKTDAIKLRRDQVGGSSARHVAHGAALAQCLVPEAEVEVCVNKVWQVATVVRVMYDGEHIRHVKVSLYLIFEWRMSITRPHM